MHARSGELAAAETAVSTCTLAGITASLTNTAVTTGVDGATNVATATGTASVTVTGSSSGSFSPPAAPVTHSSPPASSVSVPSLAALSFSGLETILLDTKKPHLKLTAKLSKAGGLVLVLLGPQGKTLARWSLTLSSGSHQLSLLLPLEARHAGHDRLRIGERGTSKTTTLAVVLRL